MTQKVEKAEVLTPEVITENPIQERVSQEITKFNLADAAIAQMKEEASKIEIKGIEDKAGYKIAKEMLSKVKKTRTSVEAKRKDLKSEYLEIGRGIDGEAKRLTDSILEIEEPLSEKIRAIDNEIQAEKERKEREAEEKLKARVEELLSIGLEFNGMLYVRGNISVDIVTIKNLNDKDYEVLKSKVILENERLDREEAERKAEEERIEAERKAEAERVEAERIRQEEAQKKLDEEREKFEREKAEYEKKIREERLVIRVDKLVADGASQDDNSVYFIGESGNVNYGKKLIEYWSEEEFAENREKLVQTIAQIKANDQAIKLEREEEARKNAKIEAEKKAEEEARQAVRDEEERRNSKLVAMGMIFDGNFYVYKSLKISRETVFGSEDFSEILIDTAKEIENIDREEAKKIEEEKLAKLPDLDKIERYIQEINLITIPAMTTEEGAELLSAFRTEIKLTIDNVESKIKSLK